MSAMEHELRETNVFRADSVENSDVKNIAQIIGNDTQILEVSLLEPIPTGGREGHQLEKLIHIISNHAVESRVPHPRAVFAEGGTLER